MKLYATVTSERASKGQGGNEYIEVEVKDDNKERVALLRVSPATDSVGGFIQMRLATAEHVYLDVWGDHVTIKDNTKDKSHPFMWNCDCKQCLPERMRKATKGEKQKGELCRVQGHENDGMGYCKECNIKL